jgi:hypothetical protein
MIIPSQGELINSQPHCVFITPFCLPITIIPSSQLLLHKQGSLGIKLHLLLLVQTQTLWDIRVGEGRRNTHVSKHRHCEGLQSYVRM